MAAVLGALLEAGCPGSPMPRGSVHAFVGRGAQPLTLARSQGPRGSTGVALPL